MWSWRFNVRASPGPDVELNVSLRERCGFRLGSARYEFRAKGILHRTFDLLEGDTVIATAKASNLRRTFDIEHRGRRLTLKAKGIFRRTFLLLEGDDLLGTITPTSLLWYRAIAELPESIPAPGQLFIVWLVLVMWKREVAAAGAS